MRFITLIEKNGDLSVLNLESIHAVYMSDGECAIDYGYNQTLYLDISTEEVANKIEGILIRKEVFS